MEKNTKAIIRLAEINASGDSITENEFLERRDIIDLLEKAEVIELAIPKEIGKFVFTSKESQDLYVEAFDKKKMDIAREATSKLDGIYMLIKWPESQLLMDEMKYSKVNQLRLQHLKLLRLLLNGKKLMVTDADAYGSSQSAFPRRIKDIKASGIQVRIDKILIPSQSGKLVKYSQYSL